MTKTSRTRKMEITDNLPSSDLQSATTASPATEEVAQSAEQVYPMSRQGRRQAFILLVGVLSIWIFALWTLITILQDGVSGVEWVSLALMLGLLVVAPVVAWALLEEANSRITVGDQGIKYQTLAGSTVTYGWDDLSGLRPTGGRGKLARFFLGDDDATTTATSERADGADDEEEPGTLSL